MNTENMRTFTSHFHNDILRIKYNIDLMISRLKAMGKNLLMLIMRL